MPTLKRYQNKPGYYINAGIDGRVITYQTSPKARQLFDGLGFNHGSSISWKMIQDLQSRGDVYTGGSGVESIDTDDSITGLSSEQEKIYEMYLQYDSLQRSTVNRVDSIFHSLDDALSSNGLKTTIHDSLIAHPIEGILHCLEALAEPPYPITNFDLNGPDLVLEFTVEDSAVLSFRDVRWTDVDHDFEGSVEYKTAEGTDATYSVKDGYFTDWAMADGNHCETDDWEKAHKSAFNADFGRRRGLGFNISNWTEVVRKLFLFLNHYDIRPYRSAHRGLCSLQELEGKHIWVTANHTTATQSSGHFVITDELADLHPIGVNELGDYLVEVGEIDRKKASARPVPLIAGSDDLHSATNKSLIAVDT
ncbi:hypothetical protein [Natronosalvus vescus]|uniref:hypothetical protein n=1 Tax=Natronosalvus vescus TaxID=2953881 RepID=UPI00209122A1|nr:hypothetical protein [Natronosalvus vescus]